MKRCGVRRRTTMEDYGQSSGVCDPGSEPVAIIPPFGAGKVNRNRSDSANQIRTASKRPFMGIIVAMPMPFVKAGGAMSAQTPGGCGCAPENGRKRPLNAPVYGRQTHRRQGRHSREAKHTGQRQPPSRGLPPGSFVGKTYRIVRPPGREADAQKKPPAVSRGGLRFRLRMQN